MSDHLVKRLRTSWDTDRSIISQTGVWMLERRDAADRIEELEAKLTEFEAQNKRLGDMYHKRGNDLAWAQRQLKRAETNLAEVTAERDKYHDGWLEAEGKLSDAEAALKTARRDALEEAAALVDQWFIFEASHIAAEIRDLIEEETKS